MEENNNSNNSNNINNFEVISSKTSNANFKEKKHNNFGKNILLPFVCVISCFSLVIGTCFVLTSIK